MRQAVKMIGGNIAAGQVAGVSDEMISRYLNGKAKPSFETVAQIAIAANCDLMWLATGRGPMVPPSEMTEAPENRLPAILDLPTIASELIQLPLLEVTASAGAGALVEAEGIDRMIAFDPAWLRRHHITPGKAHVLTARGDSMEPTIRTGDLLIVDTDITTPVDSGIYVVNYDGSLLVKRLFLLRNGGVIISSDNKITGRDEEIQPGSLDQLRVIGRVMWYGRDI